MNAEEVKAFLDKKYLQFNNPEFIENDPICIPHLFKNKEDIEVSGFFAAILAWGKRKTIIQKCMELMQRMDNAPFEFIKNHSEQDLKQLLGFKHRTFNDTDLLFLVERFHYFFNQNKTIEDLFLIENTSKEINTEKLLLTFKNRLFSTNEFPERTKKHISSPESGSACKRLNMYLRWMVRKDKKLVDFGIWNQIKPNQLICPCDVHVDRIARRLGLLTRKNTDWLAAVELTNNLKQFDSRDPVKYDFALFGIGIEEK